MRKIMLELEPWVVDRLETLVTLDLERALDNQREDLPRGLKQVSVQREVENDYILCQIGDQRRQRVQEEREVVPVVFLAN